MTVQPSHISENMVGNLTQDSAKLKRIFIEPKLPEGLAPLAELAQNIWWCWNHDAIELFQSIDLQKFIALQHNPLALLDELSIERAQELLADKDFMAQLKRVHKSFRDYMDKAPAKKGAQIGYFCMEYGCLFEPRQQRTAATNCQSAKAH